MAWRRDREDIPGRRRWPWVLLGLVVVLPGVLLLGFYLVFDPNDHKDDVIARVRKATGRELVLAGPVRLKLALRPTVEARDVSFSNMEGGSPGPMLRVARVQATLGLFALFRGQVEIDRLILERPEILLETDARGQANWRIAPRPAQPASALAVDIKEVRISGGTLTWREAGGFVATVPLVHMDLDAESPATPMAIQLRTAWNGEEIVVGGQLGSFAGLRGASAAAWPFRLQINAAGARASLVGALAPAGPNPAQPRGYQLRVEASAPDLAGLRRIAGMPGLPALRDASFSADLIDRGAGPPEIKDAVLRLGANDLGFLAAGLKLTRLEMAAANPAQAMTLEAHGLLGTVPLTLGASFAAPFAAVLQNGKLGLEMNLTGAGAALSAKGEIGDPRSLARGDIRVALALPDAQQLAPALPPLRALRAQARVQWGEDGLLDGLGGPISLREIAVDHADLALTGEVRVKLGSRPGVAGDLAARRINLDALLALAGVPADGPAGARADRGDARGARRVIPDTPLPFALLRQADVDMRLRAEDVVHAGASHRNLSLRLDLRDGRMRLDPFSVDLPAGRVSLSLDVDAGPAMPLVAMVARAPGLALKRLYNDLGREGDASGLVEVDLDLRGRGGSPRAILANASGHLGLAVAGGSIENRILNLGLLGDLLRAVKLGDLLGRGGNSQLRCFALRLEARNGAAETRALLLDSSTLLLEGGGGVNLADETLALRLRMQPRLGGIGVAVPLRVGGTLGAPRAVPDASGLLGAAGQTATGAVGAAADVAGAGVNTVTGALGLGAAAPVVTDNCASQLAIARGGRAGVVPAPPPAPRQPGRGPRVLERLTR